MSGEQLPTEIETSIVNTSQNLTDAVSDQADDIKSILESFYLKFNPEKVSTITHILERYNGNEVELLENLKEKYNIEVYKPFDDYLATHAKSDPSTSSTTPVEGLMPASNQPKPANIPPANNTQQGVGLSAISMNMQDISTNIAGTFLNWGIGANNNSSVPPNSSTKRATSDGVHSSADELLWISRVNTLQQEISNLQTDKATLESTIKKQNTQLANYKKENTIIKNDLTETKTRLENLQRNLVDMIERESQALKDSQNFNDQLKGLDKIKSELSIKLEQNELQKMNKHNQLLDMIQINHRMEAQLRYLTMKAFENFNAYDSTAIEQKLKITEEQTDKEFEQVMSSLPEIKKLHEQLSYLDVNVTNSNINNNNNSSNNEGNDKISLLEHKSKEALIKDIENLWKVNHVLKTMYAASRVELRLEIKQSTLIEERTIEQQTEIDQLREKLSTIVNDLETASGSADNLKRQISDANAEINYYKNLLRKTETNLEIASKELLKRMEEIKSLQESINNSELARAELTKSCFERIKVADTKANEYISSMQERILLEREEILSKLSNMIYIANNIKIAASVETQHELQKLRDELLKSRRNETQKDRENIYLQRQLVEASKKIAQLIVDKENENNLQHNEV